MSRPIPVILDVDTGLDDACAILLAAQHPAVDLRAISCVAGNATVDQVVTNTLTVLDTAGRPDVPVSRGAPRPLLEPGREARDAHGSDGLGDLDWPKSERTPDGRHAVELLRDTLLDAAGQADPAARVTLVPLGPLTNIALLLRTYPGVAEGLREIVFMGGSAQAGNVTASAEFNVWHDPEAAAIVLESAGELGVPVTMYGLDVFYDVTVSMDQARALIANADRRSAELAGLLVAQRCGRYRADKATIGDAGAVCAVIDRSGLTTRNYPIRVELSGLYSRGRTIVDPRDWSSGLVADPHGLAPTTVSVAVQVDSKRYANLWLETVSRAGTDPSGRSD
jgi:pyrimidine-specific ribonucleoside hydrolase